MFSEIQKPVPLDAEEFKFYFNIVNYVCDGKTPSSSPPTPAAIKLPNGDVFPVFGDLPLYKALGTIYNEIKDFNKFCSIAVRILCALYMLNKSGDSFMFEENGEKWVHPVFIYHSAIHDGYATYRDGFGFDEEFIRIVGNEIIQFNLKHNILMEGKRFQIVGGTNGITEAGNK